MNTQIKEGQVWFYKSRDGEENSRLTILKVGDAVNDVHISVDGLRMKNSNAPDSFLTDIEHLPISLNALLNSVVQLVEEIEVSPGEGYFYWREEFLAGKAGVWDISVAAAVELIEQAQNKLILPR